MTAGRRPVAAPFFLDTGAGRRFCLYHAPAPQCDPRGAILYIHPFGEEMNLSRRMAALQARAFADAGYGVLQIDLYGCGDSDGELRDADWETWRQDVGAATAWLRAHVSPEVTLWGLRLGATLVLDAVCSGKVTASQCILWQPVITGKAFMNQFLRLALAAEMMLDPAGKKSPRDMLAQGQAVEVGGYELAPALVHAIDQLDFSGLHGAGSPLHWFELVPDALTPVPAARMNIAQRWIEQQGKLHLNAITGPAFWATTEVTECARLIAETTGVLAEVTA